MVKFSPLFTLVTQMYTGSLPWCDLSREEIIDMVVKGNGRLRFRGIVPAPYEDLVRACMAFNPTERPQSFSAICSSLAEILQGMEVMLAIS